MHYHSIIHSHEPISHTLDVSSLPQRAACVNTNDCIICPGLYPANSLVLIWSESHVWIERTILRSEFTSTEWVCRWHVHRAISMYLGEHNYPRVEKSNFIKQRPRKRKCLWTGAMKIFANFWQLGPMPKSPVRSKDSEQRNFCITSPCPKYLGCNVHWMDLGEAGMDGKKVNKKYLLRYSLPQPLGTNPTHSPRQYAANSTQVMMQEQAWVTLCAPPPLPRLTLSSLNTPPTPLP